MPTSGEISLYIHVPFCTKKCDYCHFFILPNKDSLKTDWFNALKKEWILTKPLLKGYEVVTLYFGGGTPSLIPPEWIGEIISWLDDKIPQEITLEANPEDLTEEKVKAFLKVGINRISLGVQSLKEEELLTLGRTHSTSKAINAIHSAFNAGCEDISIDLMYDLPNQTLDSWIATLDQVNLLPITHLSLYNLTIEPNTPFYKRKETLIPTLPADETSKEMYLIALEKLKSFEFKHYEISAFCRNNKISKHNTGYWTGRPFLGLGPSAFSYYEGKRIQNAPSLSRYKKALNENQLPHSFEEKLDPKEKQRELFLIHLRLIDGVNLTSFEKAFGPLPKDLVSSLQTFESIGWITNSSTCPTLTLEGMLFFDSIAEEIV
ncbi:radical SAM family heme chaperone HemW [Chlamydiales bacterium]|nr:radical SAM family heme chaperone HemW [Chlamydiales bacterium]